VKYRGGWMKLLSKKKPYNLVRMGFI